MPYKQLIKFTLKNMGTTKNFCLRNVRQGFGIAPKYANAKQAMNENLKNNTLHTLNDIPNDCAVPVFTATGIWGHVMVYNKGTYYSDGKKTSKPDSTYRWGEMLNGKRVVTYTEPSKITVGSTVIVNGCGTGNSLGGGGLTKKFINRKMMVISIKNGRYALNQYNKMGAVTGWFTESQITKG